jgi:hypothetical protein
MNSLSLEKMKITPQPVIFPWLPNVSGLMIIRIGIYVPLFLLGKGTITFQKFE